MSEAAHLEPLYTELESQLSELCVYLGVQRVVPFILMTICGSE